MGDDDVTEAPVVLDGVTLQWGRMQPVPEPRTPDE